MINLQPLFKHKIHQIDDEFPTLDKTVTKDPIGVKCSDPHKSWDCLKPKGFTCMLGSEKNNPIIFRLNTKNDGNCGNNSFVLHLESLLTTIRAISFSCR
ncbi:hypothetical protein CEXT_797481 [Caerostris extrusa]|uniref:Uncharacterized protein n=1 Tax=Caerostris extrusa TaxID=172846 RepID=A0AAV4SCZ5_CAEEX|nr:hypothetical protein CEXT_797481 [Caerostris extrusa]